MKRFVSCFGHLFDYLMQFKKRKRTDRLVTGYTGIAPALGRVRHMCSVIMMPSGAVDGQDGRPGAHDIIAGIAKALAV